MWHFGRRATKVLQRPGAFALAVLKGFRANQGVLLAGAVAYYTLLARAAADPRPDGPVAPLQRGPAPTDPAGISRVCRAGSVGRVGRRTASLPGPPRGGRRRSPGNHAL